MLRCFGLSAHKSKIENKRLKYYQVFYLNQNSHIFLMLNSTLPKPKTLAKFYKSTDKQINN